MKAIILVGGEGTRLRPLTFEMPKQMLPLLGRPFIEHVCEFLGQHGITEVVLSLGYKPHSFVEAYPDGVIAGLQVEYVTEPAPLDTAGAIRFAAVTAGVTDTFVVMNGDVFTDFDLSALVNFHKEKNAIATISLQPVEDPSRFGVVLTDDEGRVQSFIEKPPRDEASTNLINAGTYVMDPTIIDGIRSEGRVSIEREVFPDLAARGALYALPADSYWLDSGTPVAFLQGSTDLLANPTTPGVVDGNWVHPEAVIDASAVIEGSVVDHGCVIGANAVVRNAILMPGVVVDEGALIDGSIIGPRATIGAGASLRPTCVVAADFLVPSTTVAEGDTRLA